MDRAIGSRSGRGQKVRFGMMGRTLVTMLVVGLLPLALFGGFALEQEAQRIRDEAERSMRANGERMASQVDDWVV